MTATFVFRVCDMNAKAVGGLEVSRLRYPRGVEGEATVKRVGQLIGDKAKPVPISGDLLSTLDQTKRLEFLKQWQAAIKGQ